MALLRHFADRADPARLVLPMLPFGPDRAEKMAFAASGHV